MNSLGNSLSVFFCIPFVGMLLSIAVVPLFWGKLWEQAKPAFVGLWSLLFLIPFTIRYGICDAWEELSGVIFDDYLTFIVLLLGLFCVAGNICLSGTMIGKPRTNILLLAIGTLLSGWVGTTGASMLMIRPIIRANRWRKRKAHIIVFFIFLVSNIGGCLTPVGDPPLLMGFVNGVPFTWSFRLMPILFFNMVLLLTMFFIIDRRAYNKDIVAGSQIPKGGKEKLHLEGAHNFFFLLLIIVAVVLSGVLPKVVPLFSKGIVIYRSVKVTYASLLEIVLILLATAGSFITTNKKIRKKNQFNWDPIVEVAVLFVGIFITMIPALLILKAKGASLGLVHPWQFFWMTGLLSSFLDNTPTYLVFFATALGLHFKSGVHVLSGDIPQTILTAISMGAVFMGTNTYIGNAPNFMVHSIAEEHGIKMPSFFGYMGWSLCCLVPVFLLDTFVFLR
jgi:Na+/H+ antiporter NhaD/arsenite permease-like protein